MPIKNKKRGKLPIGFEVPKLDLAAKFKLKGKRDPVEADPAGALALLEKSWEKLEGMTSEKISQAFKIPLEQIEELRPKPKKKSTRKKKGTKKTTKKKAASKGAK